MSYLRIPKVRVVISKLVDHVLYDPFGITGNTNPVDYITITELSRNSINKVLADPFNSLDAIVLRYLAGRRVTDSVTMLDSVIAQFVTAVLRNIDETISILDQKPAFLYLPTRLTDSISLNDADIRFIRLRDQKPTDSISIADTFSRAISAYRVFADNVGMIDNFTLIDGSTYTLDKGIRDFLTIGSDIPGRVSNNAAENISFLSLKLLRDSTTNIDRIAKLALKQLTDPPVVVTDADQLRPTKQLTDALANSDTTTKRFTKVAADAFEVGFEKLVFTELKSLTDTASMIDNFDLGDQLVYDAVKEFFDEFLLAENVRKTILKTVVDVNQVNILDDSVLGAILLDSGKFSTDSTEATDFLTEFINKTSLDSIDITDVLRIIRPYVFADTVIINDNILVRKSRIVEFATDAVTIGESNTDRFDKFYFIKRPIDTAEVTEELKTLTRFRRAPHQGFAEQIPALEKPVQNFVLNVGGGVFDNIPLLRTNLLYFSEQFGAVYWRKENTTVRSDEIPHPDLVYNQPSTTLHDPTYDAANILEIFEGYQHNNPAGRAWYREAKLKSQTQAVSAAEEVKEDVISGRHYIQARADAEFTDFERVAFSVNLKPITRRYARIDLGTAFSAIYDLQLGLVLSHTGESAQIGRTSTDGWYRCQFTARLPKFVIEDPEYIFVLDVLLNYPDNPRGIRRFDLLPSERDRTIRISALEDADLGEVYMGTGAGAFYIWGGQLEIGDQVEQEISALTYQRTVGGQLSKYGFNITPNDTDRVWVGSIHRDRGIWPTRTHNDDRERVSFFHTKIAKRAGVTNPLGTDNIISADAGTIAFGTSVLTNIRSF